MSKPRCVTITSGGMDSVTLAYFMDNAGYEQDIVSVNYGQRHAKEVDAAKECMSQLGIPSDRHHIINLSDLGKALSGSALTSHDDVDVPEGHYNEENMKATIVPNRNAILLSIAYGVAVANQAEVVAYGAHAGDHAIYPDCRPDFIDAFRHAMKLGNQGSAHPDLQLIAPFKSWDKAQIARWGLDHSVPYEKTWTCYKGGATACGRCATCVERLEAFSKTGADDPLQYEDRDFWKAAVEKFNQVTNISY